MQKPFLPVGGSGEYRVESLRIQQTILGEFSYVLDGYHPHIWTLAATNSGDFEMKAPEEELTETTHEPLI